MFEVLQVLWSAQAVSGRATVRSLTKQLHKYNGR